MKTLLFLLASLFSIGLFAQIEDLPDFVEESKKTGSGRFERFQEKGRYGFRAPDGSVWIPAIYNQLPPFPRSFMVLKKGTEVGVIDLSGKELLPFGQYDKLEMKQAFQTERIDPDGAQWIKDAAQFPLIAYKDGMVGLVNPYGEVILPLEYTRVEYLTDRYYAVFDGNLWRICDSGGAWLPEAEFELMKPQGKTLWLVGKDGKEGLYEVPGVFLLPIEYDAIAFDFERSVYRLTRGDQTGTYDLKTGELLMETGGAASATEILPLKGQIEPYYLIHKKSTRKYGLGHATRGELIPPIYDYVQAQGDYDWFLVAEGRQKALFDTTGLRRTPFAYEVLASAQYNTEVAVFNREGKKGLLRIADGQEVSDDRYSFIFELPNGYFTFSDGNLNALGSPEGLRLTGFLYADIQPAPGGKAAFHARLEDFSLVCLDAEGVVVDCGE